MRNHSLWLASCGVSWTVAVTSPLAALEKDASIEQFYRGRKVSLHVGYTPGGGYDAYARLLARHMGQKLSGAAIVTQNMPGAGSLRLTNWLYNAAAKDGSVIGAVSRGAAFEPLLGGEGAQFDAVKFNWIGSINNEGSVCVTWAASGISNFKDLQRQEVIMGANRADTDQFPRILNEVLKTKIRIVLGYPGGNEINLAMERGEVQGRCGWSWSSLVAARSDWLTDKKINVIVQMATRKHPDLQHVPLALELTDDPEEKSLLLLMLARQTTGRPIVAPPGVPEDRVAALREAFMSTTTDRDFLSEADKAQLEIEPVAGLEVQELIRDAYATPKAIVERAKKALRD